jgi:hypothetical protein
MTVVVYDDTRAVGGMSVKLRNNVRSRWQAKLSVLEQADIQHRLDEDKIASRQQQGKKVKWKDGTKGKIYIYDMCARLTVTYTPLHSYIIITISTPLPELHPLTCHYDRPNACVELQQWHLDSKKCTATKTRQYCLISGL